MIKFDLVVVGGGSGGCVVAEAMAELGYRVCILDQKVREEIGEKVCGEAVGKHHFDSLGIAPPKGEELDNMVVGIDVFSPDLETVFRIKGEGLHGFVVDRLMFGQRLLRNALDKGAELLDRTLVLDPIFKDGFVVGVKAKKFRDNERIEVYGKAVVDASGMAAVLRKKMPLDWGIEREIRDEDVEICYREIREMEGTIGDHEFLRIYLNQGISPGGYCWVFPKGEKKVNVGIGVKMSPSSPNPKTQLYTHVLSQPLFANSKVIKGGGGIVSTRRPINCMTGNGILFIGDSACQPNPIHGGGIGPSMISGKLAAKVLNNAFEREDFSRESLWAYNTAYMKSYGAKTAGLDIFRMFLQKCSDDDLNHGMKNRLITEEDILKASMGEDLRLNITDKAQRAFKGIRRLSFLKTLSKTAKKMKEAKKLYEAYPSPQGFEDWVQSVNAVVEEFKKQIL